MRKISALIDDLIREKLKSVPPFQGPVGAAQKEAPRTGTVVIAFPYNRGILFGADRQVSWGYSKIFRSNFPKIQQVGNFSALAFCGTVSRCQWITDIYQEIVLKLEMRINGELPLKSQRMVFTNLMRSFAEASGGDAGAGFIYAGINRKNLTGILLEFCSDSSVFKPDSTYLVSGSGTIEADAVLKDFWSKVKSPKEITEKTAITWAIKAIRRAAEKDTGVGDPRLQSATIALIDAKTGFRLVSQAEILKAVKAGGNK